MNKNTKSVLTFIFLAVVVTGVIFLSKKNLPNIILPSSFTPPVDWNTYKSDALGLEFRYPAEYFDAKGCNIEGKEGVCLRSQSRTLPTFIVSYFPDFEYFKSNAVGARPWDPGKGQNSTSLLNYLQKMGFVGIHQENFAGASGFSATFFHPLEKEFLGSTSSTEQAYFMQYDNHFYEISVEIKRTEHVFFQTHKIIYDTLVPSQIISTFKFAKVK
jgi:hypothetical protein